MLLEIDSVYLAKCIYNKGCNAESTLSDLPAYIQPNGQLKISSFNDCTYINLKYWTSIYITTHCDDKLHDIELVGYPYLESFNIFSSSSTSTFFQYANIFRLESIISIEE